MKFSFPILALLFIGSLQAQAQAVVEKCAFDEHYHNLLSDSATHQNLWNIESMIYQKSQELKDAGLSQNSVNGKTNTVVYTIPVVVHVVYATDYDNISVAQIEDGLRILNEDYQRLNPDASQTRAIFQGVAADMQIEFKLAKKDPNGNCTDGITRTKNVNACLTGGESAKVVKWDRTKYLNIWITRNVSNTSPQDPNGYTLGYSFMPGTGGSGDGVILRHDEMGVIGTAVGPGNAGRTLTHEVGHYLALHHPFAPERNNSGNNASNPCLRNHIPNPTPSSLPGFENLNDFCADTPPAAASNFGCNLGTNSCSNDSPDLPDQIENYMDYADCQNMFTLDQKARAHAVLSMSSLRANLVSTSNLQATGLINPPACPPVAGIDASKKIICTNEQIQFFDLSEEGDPSTWSWSFPGGNPASSTLENPMVTYANPGKYAVTLSVTNSAGSNTKTFTDFITVKNSANPLFVTTWTESFENGGIPVLMNVVDGDDGVNGDGNAFTHYANAGSHQTSSLVLLRATNSFGQKDQLISPAINTSNGSDLNLFFDYAFAATANENDDQLEVYVSRDCGDTWIRRRFYNGGRLRTAANTTGIFVPNASQWATETINFNAYIGNDPIFIKFVFENGGGNNFYLDNIRFGEGQDVSSMEYESADMAIYPNPTEGLLNLKLSDLMDRELDLQITDLSGKQVFLQNLSSQGPSLDVQLNLDLVPGLYLVNLKGENTRLQQKLIIE